MLVKCLIEKRLYYAKVKLEQEVGVNFSKLYEVTFTRQVAIIFVIDYNKKFNDL